VQCTACDHRNSTLLLLTAVTICCCCATLCTTGPAEHAVQCIFDSDTGDYALYIPEHWKHMQTGECSIIRCLDSKQPLVVPSIPDSPPNSVKPATLTEACQSLHHLLNQELSLCCRPSLIALASSQQRQQQSQPALLHQRLRQRQRLCPLRLSVAASYSPLGPPNRWPKAAITSAGRWHVTSHGHVLNSPCSGPIAAFQGTTASKASQRASVGAAAAAGQATAAQHARQACCCHQ
jgi:hypothetical protein